MPNWCYTEYTIKSSNKDALKHLDALLTEWTSKNFKETDFGHEWLGNIVGNSGIYPKESIDVEKSEYPVGCRGSITDHCIDKDGNLYISTETAWGPQDGLFVDLADRFIGDYGIDYSSEADGEYYSNYLEGYIVEYAGCDESVIAAMKEHFDDEERADHDVTEEKLRNFCKDVLKDEYDEDLDIVELIEALEDSDEDLMVHEWEKSDMDYEAGYYNNREIEADR